MLQMELALQAPCLASPPRSVPEVRWHGREGRRPSTRALKATIIPWLAGAAALARSRHLRGRVVRRAIPVSLLPSGFRPSFRLFLGKGSPLNSTNQKRVLGFSSGHWASEVQLTTTRVDLWDGAAMVLFLRAKEGKAQLGRALATGSLPANIRVSPH